jgi:hypothetical protein
MMEEIRFEFSVELRRRKSKEKEMQKNFLQDIQSEHEDE